MTEAGFLKELILVSGFAFGWVLIGHEEYAKAKGWPVIVRLEDAGYVKLLAVMTMVGAVISSLFVTPWWFVFITLVGGFAFGLILIQNLQKRDSAHINNRPHRLLHSCTYIPLGGIEAMTSVFDIYPSAAASI